MAPVRTRREGKRILVQLREAGIAATDVTHHRESNTYSVDFDSADIDNFHSKGTDPARVWARRICEKFPDLEIVNIHDAVADWRPRRPVLTATVLLRSRSR